MPKLSQDKKNRPPDYRNLAEERLASWVGGKLCFFFYLSLNLLHSLLSTTVTLPSAHLLK